MAGKEEKKADYLGCHVDSLRTMAISYINNIICYITGYNTSAPFPMPHQR